MWFAIKYLCSVRPGPGLWSSRETPMTLSSSSHQQRKSMLPTPHLLSSISSRRAAMNNTSRIARRVPYPPLLVAPQASFHNTPVTQPNASVPPPAGNWNCNLHLPEFGSRRAGSPSRIPSPSGQASCPTPGRGSLSPSIRTLRPSLERRRVEAHYPAPLGPASVETKNKRFKDQGDTNPVQHPGTDIGAPAPPVRHLPRHPASTALAAFSRVENSPPVGGGPTLVLARKKSTLVTSSNGKENCRPKAQARIRESPPPVAAPVATIPLRPIRRTAIAQRSRASCRETLQRPLVIRKRSPQSLPESSASAPGHSLAQVRSAAGASVIVPKGIKALMGDLDRFAKEWTVMSNNFFASAETTSREDGFSNSDPSSRIHSTVKPENAEASQVDNPATGKVTGNYPVPRSSGSVASVNALKASGSHSDDAMLKDAPLEVRTEPDLSEMASASAQDSPSTDSTHLHPPKAILRRQPIPITPQASRYLPPLPEYCRLISRLLFLVLTW
ncbi:hypothetical protein BJV78DRAFT_688968 [Lactifluus subvellereus]|nr:hypothetical protein BJV78DRAFT_688968 [Lactifluus subvellereus]